MIDKPRHEQNPLPNVFFAKMEPILSNKGMKNNSLAPILAYTQKDGSISNFARKKVEKDDPSLRAPEEENSF